jgi:hypothetical protein
MTKPGVAAFFLLSQGAWAQPAIAPPTLGFIEDGAHALRPAYGLAGNFILGPRLASNVVSTAFSGSVGLGKTDSSLIAFDSQGRLLGSMHAPPGPALFAFSPSGVTALAYFASSNSLVEWRGSAFAPLSVDCGADRADTVVAIAFPSPFEASLVVERTVAQGAGEIWQLHLPLGAVGSLSENALAGVRAPVLALPSGDLVYADKSGMVVRRINATEVRIAARLPAIFSLQQMTRDWVQLSDLNSSARFAIHTATGHESFYRLPE